MNNYSHISINSFLGRLLNNNIRPKYGYDKRIINEVKKECVKWLDDRCDKYVSISIPVKRRFPKNKYNADALIIEEFKKYWENKYDDNDFKFHINLIKQNEAVKEFYELYLKHLSLNDTTTIIIDSNIINDISKEFNNIYNNIKPLPLDNRRQGYLKDALAELISFNKAPISIRHSELLEFHSDRLSVYFLYKLMSHEKWDGLKSLL